MKRQCTLCKYEFLHGSVEKLHGHLNLCFNCQKAITEMCRKEWLQTW
jgi:hypothetical protein